MNELGIFKSVTSHSHMITNINCKCSLNMYLARGTQKKFVRYYVVFFQLGTLRTLPPSPSCLIRKFWQYPMPFLVVSTFSATCPPTQKSGEGDAVAFAFATDFLNHDVMLVFLWCTQLLRWEFELVLPPKLRYLFKYEYFLHWNLSRYHGKQFSVTQWEIE